MHDSWDVLEYKLIPTLTKDYVSATELDVVEGQHLVVCRFRLWM